MFIRLYIMQYNYVNLMLEGLGNTCVVESSVVFTLGSVTQRDKAHGSCCDGR